MQRRAGPPPRGKKRALRATEGRRDEPVGLTAAAGRPNHVVTFLRKEHLPPNEACFQVPLRFTKFDLRDYLWKLYGVEVRRVRAYVKAQPLARRSSSSASWYRPQALKVMTAELAQPFSWPEVPADAGAWSNELWRMREGMVERRNEERLRRHDFSIPLKSREPLSEERKELAGLARRMLDGEVKWSNDVELDPKWDDVLAASGRGGAEAEAATEESGATKP